MERLRETLDMDFADRLILKTFRLPLPRVKELTSGCGPQVDPDEFIRNRLFRHQSMHPFYQLMHFHFTVSLPDDMLTKVDCMSMSHSLEVRLPFLDHRLVEYTAGLNKNVKMRGLERKRLLRWTIGKELPGPLLRAAKRGFIVPLREWFKNTSYRDHLAELPQLVAEGFDGPSLSHLVEEHVSGKTDFGQILWMLSLLARWLKRNQ